MKTLFLLSLLALTANAATINIDNFHEIKTGLYRGARPGASGLKELADLGVKTIVNIDDDQYAVEDEIQEAKKYNIEVISIPLSAWWAPSDEDINQILGLMDNPDLYPLFVHCQYGRDRTGLVSALYRVEYQKWTPEKAHDEMLENGFNTLLFLLHGYFEDRTGYED